MRRLSRCVAVACVFLLAMSTNGLAWGKSGHRLVAAIAWDNMKPATRAAAIRVLNAAPKNSILLTFRPSTGPDSTRNRLWFISVATWPDSVRSGPPSAEYSHTNWHFSDHFWHLVGTKPVSLNKMDTATINSVEQLGALSRELKTAAVPDSQKAVDLAWVIHLTGDTHQPLHNSSRVTSQFPKGDFGGNSIKLPGTELHAYWDDIPDILYAAGKSHPLGLDSPAYIQQWNDQIVKRFPLASFTNLGPVDDFAGWSSDGMTIAEQSAYTGVTAGVTPDSIYRNRVGAIAERQIAEAGYRLARLLDVVLK